MTSETELLESTEVIPSAIEQQDRASIDTQVSTAKRFPRSIAKVKQEITSIATLDQETAEGCFYTLRRQGKGETKLIQGPSVRLAEIAVSCYGNIRAGARVIANNGKFITAQGVCHDVERNVHIAFEVQRRITDKNGRVFSDDMVVVTGNAACAIAYRNAVFKVIPGSLIKPAYEAARKVAIGDAKTLTQRRTTALDTFAKMGVSRERVLATLERATVDEIDLGDVEILLGLHNAIRDGDSTIEDAFPEIKPASPKPAFMGGGTDASKSPAPTAEPAATTPATATPSPEVPPPSTPEPSLPPVRPREESSAPAAAMEPHDELMALMARDGVTAGQVLVWAHRAQHVGPEVDTVAAIPVAKVRLFIDRWSIVSVRIKGN